MASIKTTLLQRRLSSPYQMAGSVRKVSKKGHRIIPFGNHAHMASVRISPHMTAMRPTMGLHNHIRPSAVAKSHALRPLGIRVNRKGTRLI